ncbi:MAG: hypothetical protein QOC83_653 [Pseudonocardiales bacterium]|nr:hypothetical protein [Pseudonocardiales bacterium]
MSTVLERVDPMVELSRAHAAVDALLAADLSGLPDELLLAYGRDKERLTRRLAAVDHRFVGEVLARELPGRSFVRKVPFLRGLLKIDPGEAAGRIAAAEAAGPRRALTGQRLPAIYEQVAAAQHAGAISDRHARIIVDTVEKLPDAMQAEHGEQIEADLVGYAIQFDPRQLATLAIRIRYCYDQDGQYAEDVEQRARRRELTISQRVDGSSSIKGEATAELTEFLLLHLDAFARPKPEVDGFKDPRSAGQRRHDALLEALKLNVRAQQLPSVAGVSATVVLTMSAKDFEHRTGLARTGHGALLPVAEAMRISAAEYRLMNVVIDKTHGITAYSSTARLFSENQRLAMAAVDGGCTFPHCPAPPGWCEADHCTDWAQGGPTRVDAGVLGCRTHNNDAKKQGWQSTRINGRAAWIPPPWIDPDQKPRYNHLHNTQPPGQS